MPRYQLTLLLALGLSPAISFAEAPSSEIAHARRLFAEAVEAENREDWQLAAARLREAISIKETPGLRFHLAYCEEHLGRLVEALAEYDRADELLRADPGSARDVATRLEPARDALRLRIPKVTVELPANIRDAALEIDGRALSPSVFGKAIFLNPGAHTMTVSIPGHVPFVRDVLLAEGETAVTTVELPPRLASSTENESAGSEEAISEDSLESTPFSASSPLRNWVLVAEGAIATAALGVGIGYQLAATSADDRADEARAALAIFSASSPNAQCGAPASSAQGLCDELGRAVADGKSHRTVATIGFVGAGLSAAAFVGTWLFWPSESSSTTTAIRLLPSGSARGDASLILSGTF